MSTMVGPREPGDGGVDLAAVARDAELLDRLAARAEIPADDRVASLLAALAADVDEGLDQLFAAEVDYDDGAAPVVPPRRRHGRGLRATTVAVVIGATLSVSGVAAAVTGDPLAAYHGLVSAVTGGTHELPDNAAQVARLQHLLTGTRARIAHGDLDGARADLATLRAQLGSSSLNAGQRRSLEARIAALEAAIERAAAKPAPSAAPTGKNAAPHGTGGKAAGTPRSGTGRSPAKTAQPRHTKASKPARPSDGATPGQKASDTSTSDTSSTEPASQPKADSTTAPTDLTAQTAAPAPTADATAPSPGRGRGPSGRPSHGKASSG